ncbi:MFS transporter [Pectinatus haikarae]|uniref:MFS family arabinose efflux permease n=1 Tax=Pectinatus haikarae TaxID=349096 RepID=A0ABT9YCM7_9FIRM|nr:MFS transporter [Pectinatus haikarae]MDQ0204824.1 putative MFS family arabinose efflux permease [Pectinatus haikarae]
MEKIFIHSKQNLPEGQIRLTKRLIWVMAAASGIVTANLYYMQPLLYQLAAEYHITQSSAALTATLTQLGLALGFFFILPLADILERRRLVLFVLFSSGCALMTIYFSPDLYVTAAASLLVGFTSVIGQILLPFGAQLAAPKERGRVIGSIMSGILTGILLSRVASGFIAQIYNWRTIYFIAALMMLCLMIILHLELPRFDALSKITYSESLRSIIPIVKNFRGLRKASLIGAMAFCAFSAFWTSLTFLLQENYHLGSNFAGLFGLIGIAGALLAPMAGSISDRKGPNFSIGISISIIIFSYIVFIIWGYHLWGLITGIILLDIGVQCCNISSQTKIQQLSEKARSRITAIYMITFFIGGALGTYTGAWAFQHFGWIGTCIVGLTSQSVAVCAHLFKD